MEMIWLALEREISIRYPTSTKDIQEGMVKNMRSDEVILGDFLLEQACIKIPVKFLFFFIN